MEESIKEVAPKMVTGNNAFLYLIYNFWHTCPITKYTCGYLPLPNIIQMSLSQITNVVVVNLCHNKYNCHLHKYDDTIVIF